MNNNWIGIWPFIKNINPKCQTMKYIHFEQSFIGVEYICIIFQSLSRSGCLDGFIGNTPCQYQSYGRNWTLICDCRKESCNVTMWSMQGKIFKFRIINRLSKLNRWMEYMYNENICRNNCSNTNDFILLELKSNTPVDNLESRLWNK